MLCNLMKYPAQCHTQVTVGYHVRFLLSGHIIFRIQSVMYDIVREIKLPLEAISKRRGPDSRG